MEIAVKAKNDVDSRGLYESMLNIIAKIWIIAPKAKMNIKLDDLFVKNTTSGKIPRLKIRAISRIKPLNIVPYIRVNSRSSGVGTAGKNIPGMKKSITYHRIAIIVPIISRLAPLIFLSFLINILLTKSKIKS